MPRPRKNAPTFTPDQSQEIVKQLFANGTINAKDARDALKIAAREMEDRLAMLTGEPIRRRTSSREPVDRTSFELTRGKKRHFSAEGLEQMRLNGKYRGMQRKIKNPSVLAVIQQIRKEQGFQPALVAMEQIIAQQKIMEENATAIEGAAAVKRAFDKHFGGMEKVDSRMRGEEDSREG